MRRALLSVGALWPCVLLARDIVFPASFPQIPINSNEDDAFSGWTNIPAAVAGLTTYANLPHVFCLADAKSENVDSFDIAFMGAPFDTVRACAPTSHQHWCAY